MKTPMIKIALLSLLVASCEMYDSSAQYIYQAPEAINDGFETGSLEEVNMDVGTIVEAVNKIYSGRYSGVHSMLIYKDNKLVLEEYFPGYAYQWDGPAHHGEWTDWDRHTPHMLMSSTKSVTSACIGIALEQGFIESVHQSIFDYLPEHQHLKTDNKARITIEHLLTMTSGLDWKEWSAPYSSVENPCIGIWFQEKDPVSYILEKKLRYYPGNYFNYSSGNMVLLGEILKNSSNMSIDEFSQKYLFEALGIDTSNWDLKYENGVDANVLKLTPRGMAKIGVTFLNNGIWDGQRVVLEEWIKKSAHPYPGNNGINIPGENSGKMGYSYSWWTKEYTGAGKKIHMYAAGGWGGQHIMVLPEVHMVLVFTGGNYLTKRPPFKILEKHILPAIKK